MNQVIVMPYPGRGHLNPIMSLCHLLSSTSAGATVFTVVVTEEWLGMIGSDPRPHDVRFATIPNVIPSEHGRGSDPAGFFGAVQTEMEAPFEELLDRLETEVPVKLIVGDVMLGWTAEVAHRRSIPLAAYFAMSASMFTMWYHVDLLEEHGHIFVDVSEKGEELIDYIPGLLPTKVADTPPVSEAQRDMLPNVLNVTKKAQFLLFPTIYELESEVVNALKAKIQIPIYTLGPNIRHHQLQLEPSLKESIYMKWLDSNSPESVLYICLGSFLSVSTKQMEEIAASLKQSGVRFLWVARGKTSHLQGFCGDEGLVLDWCDQLRVLQHSSIGGFWSHCGWSSVKESVFSGVPMLTFPIIADQLLNAKFIVEDWKNGWKVRKDMQKESLVMRDEITDITKRFMDSKNIERKEMMGRVKKLQLVCQNSMREGGSSFTNTDSFVKNFLT